MKRGDFYSSNGGTPRSTEIGISPEIAALAHELKTPLALIRQLALFIDQDDIDEKSMKEAVERIAVTSERSLRLVSDLTKMFALSNSDMITVDTEPINIAGLCEEVAHEIWPLYKAHDKSIEIPHARGSYIAVGHRELLRRVLLSYADNALKYSSTKSIVKFSLAKSGDKVRVGVRDYGPILTKDDLNRASRNAAITGRPLSSGLGLNISEYFVKSMRGQTGSIRHKDGMTFYVAVPLSEQMRLL